MERDPRESGNNRNDRAIRSAILWYQSHFAENGLDGIKLILVTNDVDHLKQSIDQGITAYTGTCLMFLHCVLRLVVQCVVICPVCGRVCVCVDLLPR